MQTIQHSAFITAISIQLENSCEIEVHALTNFSWLH